MIARIAILSLTLAVLSACDRQEPRDPPRPTPPATGEMGQTGERSEAEPRTGTQGHQPAPPGAGEPGQHYDAGAARVGISGEGEVMTEEQRQAALRACERLQGQERERCEREVDERTDPARMQPQRQE